MKLRFLQDTRGSEDGLTLRQFRAGTTEEVGDWLARVFVEEMGVAVVADVAERETPELSAPDMETPEAAAPAMETPEKPRRGRPRKDAGNA